MKKIAIIAAMPGELKPLVEGWKHEPHNGVDLWRNRPENREQGETEWIAACAGAGQACAARAFAEAVRGAKVDVVLSIGWAGALSAEFEPGKVYRTDGVIDVKTGERFECAGATNGEDKIWLATAPRVADEAEKKRLRSTYSAALVDMEAAAVARLARMRGIPFHCLKGVSDGYKDHLPDFNKFIDKNGRFQLARFIGFTLLRPASWPALIRMGENSKKAAQQLAGQVQQLERESAGAGNRVSKKKHQKSEG
jgi:adenosylhomocysteine nucleosidase